MGCSSFLLRAVVMVMVLCRGAFVWSPDRINLIQAKTKPSKYTLNNNVLFCLSLVQAHQINDMKTCILTSWVR